MKILKAVLTYFGLAIASLIGMLFAFVELRSLFAGDFLLMNSPFLGALGYFLRGLYFLLIITLSVFIVLFRTHNKKICIILLAVAISLLVGALLSLMFYDYYVSLVIIAASLILWLSQALASLEKKNNKHVWLNKLWKRLLLPQ